MDHFKLVILSENGKMPRQIRIPKFLIKILLPFGITLIVSSFLIINEYLELRKVKLQFNQINSENNGLKGEARLLIKNLQEVKQSLEKVQNYSIKLQELTNINYSIVSEHTGIGPLSNSEYKIKLEQDAKTQSNTFIPLGIDLDKLSFKPAFEQLKELDQSANTNSVKLQQLLSNLSQKKSLLSAIPSVSPVNGWITSDFGERISPFTGSHGPHKGVDLASPIGTPIRAPADGVVIFSGLKEGYGNFIMIAHSSGIVSRYGHNSQNLVQPGQKILRGDQIGTVGMTGQTTGPHLHYEVLVNGVNVNPKKFILNF